MGDFDGTSAHELLNLMKKNCGNVDKVFIHTTGLTHIYPFGLDTFHNNLYVLTGKPIRLIFTGNNATEISQEQCNFF